VGVRVDFRWLVDLVVVSSWCRPQPPSRRKLSTMVDKKFQVGCIATIITKYRSDRRAADPSTIVSRLSSSRLPWLQHPPTSGFVSNWGQALVVSSSCSRQPACGLAGHLSCNQRFRFGGSEGTRSPLDPPSLKVAGQPVRSYHSSPREFCWWTLFGEDQHLGDDSVKLLGIGTASALARTGLAPLLHNVG
jgi:hypothetical protein